MTVKKDSDFFEKKLVAMRDGHVSKVEHREKDVHFGSQNHSEGLSLNHLADAGSDTFENDFSMKQLEHTQEIIIQIDEALQRIKKGSFGICESCQKKIQTTRLDAIPYVSNCIVCQEKEEQESE